MDIFHGLLTMSLRCMGRALNSVFGWATLLLIGHIIARRQCLMSAISFGSALWLAVIRMVWSTTLPFHRIVEFLPAEGATRPSCGQSSATTNANPSPKK